MDAVVTVASRGVTLNFKAVLEKNRKVQHMFFAHFSWSEEVFLVPERL